MLEQASISALAPDVEFTDDPRLQAVLALRRGSKAHDRRAMLALTDGQIEKAEQEYILALRAHLRQSKVHTIQKFFADVHARNNK